MSITTEQENGLNQQLYTIMTPSVACTPTNQTDAACGTGSGAAQTTYTIDPRLHSPYLMQAAIGMDRQLGKFGTVSVNYLNMRGVHEFNSNNLGAPLPEADGTIPPVSAGAPNLYQFASQGVFSPEPVIDQPSHKLQQVDLVIWLLQPELCQRGQLRLGSLPVGGRQPPC